MPQSVRRIDIVASLLCFFILLLTSASVAQMQMEIRSSEQYDAAQFEKSHPAVGTAAPDIQLQTLDGESVLLSSFRGKNVVLIKAGYT